MTTRLATVFLISAVASACAAEAASHEDDALQVVPAAASEAPQTQTLELTPIGADGQPVGPAQTVHLSPVTEDEGQSETMTAAPRE